MQGSPYQTCTHISARHNLFDLKLKEVWKYRELVLLFTKRSFAVAAHLNSEIMIMDEVLAVSDVAFQNKYLERMHKAKPSYMSATTWRPSGSCATAVS